MTIERIISGGQTGADRAAWRAARRFNLATGGWMPARFKAEDGEHPEFARLYGARAHGSASYRDRTAANVEMSDLTLVYCTGAGYFSPGTKLTLGLCRDLGKPHQCQNVDRLPISATETAAHIRRLAKELGRPIVVNVAGNRESKAPGIGAVVEDYLCGVFRALGLSEVAQAAETRP